ncbi:hypothetical protein [Marinobacter zhejiangensis]|uniref:Ubiquinone biosynthesis protein UbiH n=1 Tax=Marinobacter zhejiangensis TaxID=488535 RepID=A0A1I4L9V2_9GAMM|nr:hypothetical protein [Marinobacter zhejiangensis]SFL87740.1 hypothetical protein SAMN04487963_0363 [Marinobacter zhejiangensis]
MEAFLAITFSFPTVIFTVLLAVAVIYWLISLLGLVDLDGDADMDIDSSADVGGLMVTLGLQGVPLPLVLTLLFLSSWLLAYFADLLFGAMFGGGWGHVMFGLLVIPAALFVGLLVTSVLVRPLRPLFRRAYKRPMQKQVIGTACVVLAFNESSGKGRAEAHRDGAHLILQIRSDAPLARRDRVVLVEYLSDQQAYWVIPEADFLSGSAG